MRTYIIDGNFLGQRILNVNQQLTFRENPIAEKKELLKFLCIHLSSEISRCSEYLENVVFVKDNKSWRKSIPIVRQDGSNESDYKANRLKTEEELLAGPDMKIFFETLSYFFEIISKECNVPYTSLNGVEGDDAIWAWTKYLSANKKHSLIYCTDSDLNQLVNNYVMIHRQVKTKDSPTRGEIICSEGYIKEYEEVNSSIFDNDIVFWQSENIIMHDRKLGKTYFTPNPKSLVLKKMYCGDGKDNIPNIFYWKKTAVSSGNIQNKKITEKMLYDAISDIFIEYEIDEDFLYNDDIHKKILLSLKNNNSLDINIEKSMEILKCNRKLLYLDEKEIPTEIVNSLKQDIFNQKFKLAKLSLLKNQNYLFSLFGITNVSYFNNF